MATGRTTFDVRRGDEWIRVIIEDGFATIRVSGIDDVWPLCQAINRAVAAGATRGTLLTGEVVEDQMAAMHMMRSQKGITWMGGRVTFLGVAPRGPEFRIDWDQLPTITE